MLPCRSPIYASALLSEKTAVSGPSASATSEKSLRPPSAQPLPAGFPPAREKHGWGKYEASWSMYKPVAPRSDQSAHLHNRFELQSVAWLWLNQFQRPCVTINTCLSHLLGDANEDALPVWIRGICQIEADVCRWSCGVVSFAVWSGCADTHVRRRVGCVPGSNFWIKQSSICICSPTTQGLKISDASRSIC